MISDFIKSRFINSNQPLTARLVFVDQAPEKKAAKSADSKEKSAAEKYTEAAKKIKERKQAELKALQKSTKAEPNPAPVVSETDKNKNAFEQPEHTSDDIIKHDYSEDIQKHLDQKNTDAELNEKLPSNWFQVDSEPGKQSEGEVQARVNKIYQEIFIDDKGPLHEQVAEYNATYRKKGGDKKITAEELVFGSSVAESAREQYLKENPDKNPDQDKIAVEKIAEDKKSIRLRTIRDRLENLSKLREKQKEKLTAGNLVKNLGDGVTNITESFQENLSEGKWVEAGIQAVGMYLVLKSAWTLIKGKPDDQDWVSYLSTNVLKAAVGVAILMPDATRGKNSLLDMLKLTSAADQMDDRGLAELMKELNWRDRTHAETLNALAKTDIGDIHKAYQESRADGKSEIDPRQLLGKNAPKKSILNGKELFNIVEKVLERYGAKYFELVMGRPPATPQEIQDGITLCVRYHKVTKNQSKSFASVVALEEQSFEDWKYPERVEGKIPIIAGIASNIGLSILHPTQSPELLGEAFNKWLDFFEIDRAWFAANVSDPAKKEILAIYEVDKELAKKLVNTIKDFANTQYEIYEAMGAKTYISAVTELGVKATVELAGATFTGVYEAGKGLKDVVVEVGGQLYTNVEVYIEKYGTLGNTIVFSNWIPYKYNLKDKKWSRTSIADAAGKVKEFTVGSVKYVTNEVPAIIDNTTVFWAEYFQNTLPKQWESIKPTLEKTGVKIVGGYELFAAFTKAVIQENIIPAGKNTAKGLADFFTDDNNLIRAFYKAAKTASSEKLNDFMQGGTSIVDFLKQSANEIEHNKENIKKFDDIISKKGEEQKYFGDAITPFNLRKLEPTVRAWMFDRLGSWNLDMSASDVTKFDATGGFIEYNPITLESIGTLGTLPGLGNRDVKLRINFAADENLNGKTRFELITEDGQVLKLEKADFDANKLSETLKRAEPAFEKMSRLSLTALEQNLNRETEIKSRIEILAAVKKMSASPEMQSIFLPLAPIMENASEDFGWKEALVAPFETLWTGGSGPINENQWASLVTYKQHEMLLFYQNSLAANAKENNGVLDQKEISALETKFKQEYLAPITNDWLGFLKDSKLEDIINEANSSVWDVGGENYQTALTRLLTLGTRNKAYPTTLQNLVANFEQIDFEDRNLSESANQLKAVALWKFAEMAAPMATLKEAKPGGGHDLFDERIEENHKEYLIYLSRELLEQLDTFQQNGVIQKSVSANEVAQIFRNQLKVQTFAEFSNEKDPKIYSNFAKKMADLASAAAEVTLDTADTAARKAVELKNAGLEKVNGAINTIGDAI